MLLDYRNDEYKHFLKKIIPDIDEKRIIGIKIGILRKIERDYEIDFSELPHKYYEEDLLHAIKLSKEKDIDKVLMMLDEFLPYVDNWALCDIIKPKIFKKYPDKVLEYVKKCLKSKHVYTKRFGIVTLLNFFLDENYNKDILDLCLDIKGDYYINMAVAWFYSFALIKHYDDALYIIKNNLLDKDIHNKTIRKFLDSYRVDVDKKNYLRGLYVKKS